MRHSSNRHLLDEVNKAKTWFHAQKIKPIWARKVEEKQVVKTLEGTETVRVGDYLCRGEVGEIWPQSADRLFEKYDATEVVDSDGWRRFTPKSDAEGVLAARIDHEFTVLAEWGTLEGKPGDYLVKDYCDIEIEYPADVWVVDSGLFAATYGRLSSG